MADPDAPRDYSNHPIATDEEKKALNETQGASSSTPKITNEYVGDILGNVLDTVDLPTYHLKLYMIGPGSKNASAGSEDTPTQDTETSSSSDARKDQGEKGSIRTTGTGYLNNRVDSHPDPTQTVVLAETGVTEVGIDGLEIATIPGGGGSETTTVNFTITQPNAADFPDQIVKARQYLGAPPDGGDVPLFLELSFRGRRESDLNPDLWDTDNAGGEIMSNVAGPFVYQLMIRNFSMNIDVGGSTYEFETAVKDTLYTADAFYRTRKFYTITGRTIGQMLQDLQKQTNDYNQKQNLPQRINFGLTDGGEVDELTRVGYKKSGKRKTSMMMLAGDYYQYDPTGKTTADYYVPGLKHIKDQSLDIEDTEQLNAVIKEEVVDAEDTKEAKEASEEAREKSTSVSKDAKTNKISIDLKEGITMDKVLGILLSMNKEFMQKASRTADIDDPKNEDVDATKQVLWYKFEGSIEYGEYLKKDKQYFKTAYLIPTSFESPKTDIAIFPWETDKNNNLEKGEVTERVNQMKIRKAYEYIFTGRNDQIINCDISYNEGYMLLQPPDRGLLGDISLNAASILNPTPVDKKETIEDEGIEKLTDSADESSSQNFFDQLNKLKNDIKKGEAFIRDLGSAAQFTESQIKDLVKNSNGEAAKKLQEALSDQSTAQGIANALTEKRKTSNQANVVTQSEEFSPQESGFVYGGDLIGNTKYAEQLADKGKKFKEERTSAEDKEEESINNGIAQRTKSEYLSGFANVGATKGIKNNLFTYLYDQHQAVDFLMRLEMELRGDPWWLGKPVHKAGEVPTPPGSSAQKIEETDEDGNNYLTTTKDNFFLFSLNSPRLFDMDVENEDNNTGLWIKEGDGTSYFISGIYQVRTVNHKFNGGLYTMDIMGVKETAISLNNMERQLSQFSYVDEERKGFTAKKQDGVVTDGDREGNKGAYEKPHYANVQGQMDSSEKTAEELLEAGDITKEQYDSWVDWNEKEKKKEQERRNPPGYTPTYYPRNDPGA